MPDLYPSISCSNYIENSSLTQRKQAEGFDIQRIIEMVLQNYRVTKYYVLTVSLCQLALLLKDLSFTIFAMEGTYL